jgi:prophage DNA circulation protein
VPTEAQVQNVVLVHLSVVNAAVQADAAALVFDSAASDPALTAAEIETVIDDVRGEIEAAIAAARAALSLEESRAIVEPLKDMALALQDAARSVLEQRPPLLRRTIEAPGNLRLIAHRWYGDHARAPELLRLNSIRQPNALQPGDVLNALAA